MEEKTTIANRNSSTWKFISIENNVLRLKDELSFGVLYAKCNLIGLKTDSKKILGASTFEFTAQDKIRFLCETETSSGQKKVSAETCEISDFETRLVYSDYSAVFVLSDRNGDKYIRPEQLCLNAAKILDIKNEVSEGKALTPEEKELIPKAYAVRFVMNSAEGGRKGLKKEYVDLIRPVLEENFEEELIEEMFEIGETTEKKKLKKLKKKLKAFFTSQKGHKFFSSLMKDFSACGKEFMSVRGKKARRLITEKLKKAGFEGEYPYFRKEKDGQARFIALAEYCEFEKGQKKLKALLRCAAANIKDGKIGGVDFKDSRLYDVSFVPEGKIISLETLLYNDVTEEYIDEVFDNANDLFDGKKISKAYIKKHPQLNGAMKCTGKSYYWIWFVCAVAFGLLASLIITGMTAGIATGIASIVSKQMNDPGYLDWFIWKRGAWTDVGFPVAMITGAIFAHYTLKAVNKPLTIKKIKHEVKKNER